MSTIPATTPVVPSSRALALLVASAFFMENLDATVIVTALPQMAQTFGVAAVDVNIGITAYVLAVAVFIPASGWMADRFGHRQVFMAALALFSLSSLLCALSSNLWQFTGMRVLQGMAGAMMVPVGRLAVLNNTSKEDLLKAIAYLTWPGLTAPVLGPPLGGFLTTYASWHWIFLLNLPLGVVAFVMARRLIPLTDKPVQASAFDWQGFLLCALSCLGLLYGLERLGQDASQWVVPLALLLSSGLLLWGFCRHVAQHPSPLLRFDSLGVMTYRVTIGGGSAFRAIVSAIPFLLPLMFQLGFGYDAFTAGLLVLTLFAGNIGMKPLTGRVLQRFGFRQSLLLSGWVLAASLFACAGLSSETSLFIVLPLLLLSGMARSMSFTAYASMAFADVAKDNMTGANTLFSMSQQLAFGLGVAVAAVFLRLAEGVIDTSTQPLGAFQFAWIMLGLLALLSLLDILRLPADAGAAVSRHRTYQVDR